MSLNRAASNKLRKISNAKIDSSDQLYSIYLNEGKIEALIAATTASSTKSHSTNSHSTINDETTYDAKSGLVMPGLIDMHAHIDKSYSDSQNEEGTLLSAIHSMAAIKATRSIDTIVNNAERAVLASIKNGVSILRTHVDLADPHDLLSIEKIIELKQKYSHAIDLHVTALGATLNAKDLELMASALELGIDMIGGAPALSEDPKQSIANAIELCQAWDKGLDLHIDEKEDTQLLTLDLLADQCIEKQLSQTVLASHCCALAFLNPSELDKLLNKVKKANISIVSLPTCNLVLMGRKMQPVPRGIPPIKAILAKGISLSFASDNVSDPFNPFGNYDLLSILNIGCMASHLNSTHDLQTASQLITYQPAKSLRLDNYGIQVGADASFCITDADSLLNCAAHPPDKLATVFKGKLVYQKRVEEQWLL